MALAQNPVVSAITPMTIAVGSGNFTLSVDGTNFQAGDIVRWNMVPLTTDFQSATQLIAQVSAARVASAGTATIDVLPPPGLGK